MKRAVKDLVRPNIVSLQPFSSARAEYTGTADVFLDANENPYSSNFNRYPDPFHRELRNEIADWKNCIVDNLLLGNGSDEIIDFIVRAFCIPGVDIVRSISPTFGMYKVVAGINDVQLEEVLLDDDFDLDVESTCADQTDHHKVLFLCSPNNPTANLLSQERIEKCIETWKGIVVIDEAYIDFTDATSFVSKVDEFPNIIVLQTFSKALGAAGLRIGMCFSSPEIIKYLAKIKPPYNIGKQAQNDALKLVKNRKVFSNQVDQIVEERGRVVKELDLVDAISLVIPSNSNFLLYRCLNHLELKSHLEKHGVIVRDRSKLPKCDQCLRFTIGTPEENNMLIVGIKSFYK